jgi:hypothetical protein
MRVFLMAWKLLFTHGKNAAQISSLSPLARNRMSDEPGMRLGIDLDGSKIELIAFDPTGREHLRRRVATPRNDYRATLEAIRELIAQSERELGSASYSCLLAISTAC